MWHERPFRRSARAFEPGSCRTGITGSPQTLVDRRRGVFRKRQVHRSPGTRGRLDRERGSQRLEPVTSAHQGCRLAQGHRAKVFELARQGVGAFDFDDLFLEWLPPGAGRRPPPPHRPDVPPPPPSPRWASRPAPGRRSLCIRGRSPRATGWGWPRSRRPDAAWRTSQRDSGGSARRRPWRSRPRPGTDRRWPKASTSYSPGSALCGGGRSGPPPPPRSEPAHSRLHLRSQPRLGSDPIWSSSAALIRSTYRSCRASTAAT